MFQCSEEQRKPDTKSLTHGHELWAVGEGERRSTSAPTDFRVITGAQKCGRSLDQSPGIFTITADRTQAGEERLSILLEVLEVADNWISPALPTTSHFIVQQKRVHTGNSQYSYLAIH